MIAPPTLPESASPDVVAFRDLAPDRFLCFFGQRVGSGAFAGAEPIEQRRDIGRDQQLSIGDGVHQEPRAVGRDIVLLHESALQSAAHARCEQGSGRSRFRGLGI